MKEKVPKKNNKYEKPSILAVNNNRYTDGCPQATQKDCGIAYRQ